MFEGENLIGLLLEKPVAQNIICLKIINSLDNFITQHGSFKVSFVNQASSSDQSAPYIISPFNG